MENPFVSIYSIKSATTFYINLNHIVQITFDDERGRIGMVYNNGRYENFELSKEKVKKYNDYKSDYELTKFIIINKIKC